MLIKRYLLDLVLHHLDAKEITVITGARQVGKTTLIREVEKKLKDGAEKTLYLNLDYEPDLRYVESHEVLMQKLHLEFGNETGYVFMDEIQRKENAGLFLKGLYDLNLPVKFIVTGSGSMELKAQIHESLAGRKRVFELLPVTFNEFVQYKTGYKYEKSLPEFFDLEKEWTHILLQEYLSFGGYPRIVTESTEREKFNLMNEIYQAYIYKDVAYLLGLDKPENYKKLIGLLGLQTGKPVNFSTLSKDCGLSVQTLKRYIWYLVNTFIIKDITPFFRNKRKEITKAPVIYFNDPGFKNFLQGRFLFTEERSTDGMTFQNFIFNLLYEYTRMDPLWEIHFWRTLSQAEVDFVLVHGSVLVPVEVKYSMLKNTVLSRSMVSFIEKYDPSVAIVVNKSLRQQRIVKNTRVEFIPYYELLSVLHAHVSSEKS